MPRAFRRLMRNAGAAIFALAIGAIGVETIVFANTSLPPVHGHRVIGIIPWLPAVPWLAILFGAVLALGAAGMLARQTRRNAALFTGALLLLADLVLDVPRGLLAPANISVRTGVFELLALASLAWLLAGEAPKSPIVQFARYALAISLIVFGIDHFLALAFIATLIATWIPWHQFWVAAFGVAFVAAGVAIALRILERWAGFGVALMFAIWVVTLHAPRVAGLYGIAGATQSPAEWQSLFIAVALCGGSLAFASADS
jgi:uncharacterized membrane protein